MQLFNPELADPTVVGAKNVLLGFQINIQQLWLTFVGAAVKM